MLPVPTIFIVSMGGLALLSVVVLVSTGSIVSLLVILALVGVLGFVLFKMGVLDIKQTPAGLDVAFHEKTPAPATSKMVTQASLEKSEVFNISGNDYTYDEAAAVCAAYDAELATYDQLTTAYEAGAEWCGYGWTQGGMALFPTQQATWALLQSETDQSKRTACGRPGVNGGYFDPSNKFGVNCYGVKPGGKTAKYPLPVPGTDTASFDKMVDKFKGMLNRMKVSAFNRMGWSEWNAPGQLKTP
jgi:hypothetical protein